MKVPEFSTGNMFVCWALPVLVLPDPEPLDQIFGALQPRVQAVLLAFEAGHVLHGHTGEETGSANIRGNYITMFVMRKTCIHHSCKIFLLHCNVGDVRYKM